MNTKELETAIFSTAQAVVELHEGLNGVQVVQFAHHRDLLDDLHSRLACLVNRCDALELATRAQDALRGTAQ